MGYQETPKNILRNKTLSLFLEREYCIDIVDEWMNLSQKLGQFAIFSL